MEGLFALTLILASFSFSFAVDPLCEGVPPGVIVLFPFPDDCTKYYECNGGEKIERNCPYGLWFNNALQNCDHPEHSGCIPATTSAPTTVTTPHPACAPGIVDYFPYPYDCKQYFECYYGSLELHSCPSTLWFDAVLKRCVYPEESSCIVSSTVEPTWTTPSSACWGVLPGITELKPYPGDCNRFIECYGSQRTDMFCPPHLYFNADKQLCDWPSESGCDDTTASPPTGSTDNPTTLTTPGGTDDPRCADGRTSYWAHPDCTKFVECYMGHSFTMECPAGLFFDSAREKCVDPSESDCGRPTTNAPSTSTKDHDWTPDPFCPFPADPNERYLYPYPGDCTKFIECAEGERVTATCPPDLYFNPVLLVCDYPYQAGCEWA